MVEQLDSGVDMAAQHARRVTAQRLSAIVRSRDVVVRCDGDRFLVMTDETGPADDLKALARRVSGAIEQPIRFEDQEIAVSATVDIAPCRSPHGAVEVLVIEAALNPRSG